MFENFENFLYTVKSWFHDRSERTKVLNDFNNAARNAFIMGEVPVALKAEISRGCKEYKHSFSDWLNTGFRIKAFSGRQMTKNEIIQLGDIILSDSILVRRLVVLGWDTLEIQCDVGNFGCRWQLQEYMQITSKMPPRQISE